MIAGIDAFDDQMIARNYHRELQKVPNVCQEFGQKLKMIAKKWAN